jgi:hypothetical protein
LSVCRRQGGEVGSGAAKFGSQRRRETRLRRRFGRCAWVWFGAQGFETAAGVEERASNLIGRRAIAQRLLQLGDGRALKLEKPRAILRVGRGGGSRLLRRFMCRREYADSTKRR